MTRISMAASLALVALATADPATAQSKDDRFWFEASAFMPKIDSEIQVTATNNPTIGTVVDLEDDLGLDNDEVLPAFLAGARLGSRFSVIAEYFAIGRDATHTIDRNITIEGVTYPINGSVTTNFDTDVYRLVIGYSFVRTDTIEVGGALGLHATDFKLGIEGQGSSGGPPVLQTRRQDFLAPLPTLGLFANIELMPKLMLSGRADYLSLSIDDYDGELLNLQAKLSYRILKNVGIGAAYRYVDYQVDVEKDRYTGRFEYGFSGPALFLEVGF